MSRRSQRIMVKKEEEKPVAIGSVDDSDSEHERPAAKARRVDDSPYKDAPSPKDTSVKEEKPRRAVRRRGKLYQILDMPLDVLMEICTQLQTREMLYLTRLSKAFRAFFTSRSTLFIWKAARENVPELPPLPDDLNEMQYASLLYDAHCHKCLCKNCYFVYWACRVRLCKRCFQESAINLYGRNSISRYSGNDYTTERFLSDVRLIDRLLPPLEKYTDSTTAHYIPYLDKLVSEWKTLPKDDAARNDWKEERIRITSVRVKAEPALIAWFEKHRNSRADELSDVRDARKLAIVRKLKEDGWHLELQWLASTPDDEKKFVKLPEVRKSQMLTPRIWNSIKEPVEVFMREIRRKRLRKIYLETLTQRLNQFDKFVKDVLSKMDNKPGWAYEYNTLDVTMSIPELFPLVDPHNDPDETDWEFKTEPLRPKVQAIIQEYFDTRQGKAEKALADALRQTFELDDTVNPLTLAVGSYFSCVKCRDVYTLPNVLYHSSCPSYTGYRLDSGPEWMSDDYFQAIKASSILAQEHYLETKERPWLWSVDSFRARFEQAAKVIDVICGPGLSAKNATLQDLDKDPEMRLICTCHWDRFNKYVPIMTWRTAAFTESCCGRYEYKLKNKDGPMYKLATKKQFDAIKDSEGPCALERVSQRKGNYYEDFACARCPEGSKQTPLAWNELTDHLKGRHDIAEPGEGDWVNVRRDEAIPKILFLVSHKVRGKDHPLAYLEKQYQHCVIYFKFPAKGWTPESD